MTPLDDIRRRHEAATEGPSDWTAYLLRLREYTDEVLKELEATDGE